MMKQVKRDMRVFSAFLAVFLTAFFPLGTFAGCGLRVVPLSETGETAQNSPFAAEPAETQTAVQESVPVPEPEPEPEAGSRTGFDMIQVEEDKFWQPAGDGWILSVLSFAPTSLRAGPDGTFTAAGVDHGSDTVYLAVVDPLAMSAAEGSAALGVPDENGYRDVDVIRLGDAFLVQDFGDGNLYSIRSDFTVADQAATEGLYAGRMIGMPDGTVLFSHGVYGNLCFARIGEDGKIELNDRNFVLPEPYNEIYVNGATPEGILLVSLDNGADWDSMTGGYQQKYGLIDPAAGTVSLIPGDGDIALSVVGSAIVEYRYGSADCRLYPRGADGGFIRVRGPEKTYVANTFWQSMELMYFERNSENEIEWTALDPATARTVGRTTFPKDDFGLFVSDMAEAGEYAAFLLERYDSDGIIYLWKNRAEPESAGYPMLENNLPGRISAEIGRIYRETGINVYTGNDAVRYLDGYAMQVVEDETVILNGLKDISAFFDKCPPGFLRELAEGNSAIDICLGGKIIPQPGNRDSISDATAFVSDLGGAQVMVLDITQSGLTETVAHEFFHIAENTMWTMAEAEGYADGTPFDRWAMLNPDDFNYHWVYTDEDGNTNGSEDPRVFTSMTEDGDIDDVYFIDGYSTTYPKEDRARIFQYLAVYDPDELPEAFASAALKRKASYLCACLRRYFASVAQAEDVFWEQSADRDLYTWEYFIEQYDLDAWFAEHAYG